MISRNKQPLIPWSIILVGDLGQLPHVMDMTIYAGETMGKCLWTKFTSVIILETIFHQMGTDVTQLRFRQLLTNIYNATSTMEDWTLLKYKTNKFLSIEECSQFDTIIHLFATNMLVNNNYKYMLQSLAMPIARSIANFTTREDAKQNDDHQLEKKYHSVSGNKSCYPAICGLKQD